MIKAKNNYTNHSQKGITLVEVVVAIAIFSIISFTLLSSVIAMKKVIMRQEEYVKLEMVCYDISAYRNKYGDQWAKYYFGENIKNVGYLTYDFESTSNQNEAKYKIIFSNNKIIAILSMDGETIFAENILLPIQGGN